MTAAATAPTIDDGSLSVGTATAKMTFQYAPGGRKIALELSVTMPGDATYTATTAGGLADPAQSPLGTFQASHFGDVAVTGAGAACAGASACKLSVRGFVGGGGADTGARVTLSYVIASGTIAKAIRGAVVLKPL